MFPPFVGGRELQNDEIVTLDAESLRAVNHFADGRNEIGRGLIEISIELGWDGDGACATSEQCKKGNAGC